MVLFKSLQSSQKVCFSKKMKERGNGREYAGTSFNLPGCVTFYNFISPYLVNVTVQCWIYSGSRHLLLNQELMSVLETQLSSNSPAYPAELSLFRIQFCLLIGGGLSELVLTLRLASAHRWDFDCKVQ